MYMQDRTLSKKLRAAVKGSSVHRAVLEDMSASFEPTTILEWTEMIAAWQHDPGNMPDPFQEPVMGKHH